MWKYKQDRIRMGAPSTNLHVTPLLTFQVRESANRYRRIGASATPAARMFCLQWGLCTGIIHNSAWGRPLQL